MVIFVFIFSNFAFAQIGDVEYIYFSTTPYSHLELKSTFVSRIKTNYREVAMYVIRRGNLQPEPELSFDQTQFFCSQVREKKSKTAETN